jgi:hypothetical protein
MGFFNEQGTNIPSQEWLKIYEPYYFLGGPTLPPWFTRRYQTSRFVENQVCALLTQTTPLSQSDLILAMAWKIGGLIDHSSSEAGQKIVYLQQWPTKLTSKGGRRRTLNFSVSIPSLAANMLTILTQIQGNPGYVLSLVPKGQGFGYVYLLNVLFFASHGTFPIYDRFAHIGALAIDQDWRPTSLVNYKASETWSNFQRFMSLLLPISNALPQQPGNPSMFISRCVDRALWVYGHFFKTDATAVRKTKPCATQSSNPVTRDLDGVLVGRLYGLSNNASDGWRRREINIPQDANGYPKIGDYIHLVDSSGVSYRDLPFIKGAKAQGYACLGKPGALKPWFAKRYSVGEVETKSIYLEPTGRSTEYRIYSELEWNTRKS